MPEGSKGLFGDDSLGWDRRRVLQHEGRGSVPKEGTLKFMVDSTNVSSSIN